MCTINQKFRTAALVYEAPEWPTVLSTRQLPGNWPNGESIAGNTFFVPPTPQGEYYGDYLVVMTPPPRVVQTSIPKHRRIFVLLEPPEFWTPSRDLLEQFGTVITPYKIESFVGLQIIAPATAGNWWYGINKDGHRNAGKFLNFKDIRDEPITDKANKLSVVTSAKQFLEGHRKRLRFIKFLKEKLPHLVDIYGYGINPVTDKRDALLPYTFHLALENAIHEDYWTEKLSDPLLGRCIVFYHGAKRIKDYFSEKSVIPINIENPTESVNIILEVVSEYGSARYKSDIETAREKVLNKYNFPFLINESINIIEQRGVGSGGVVRICD